MENDLLTRGRNALSTGAWEKARALLEDAVKKEESAEVYEELAWACWWLNDLPGVFEKRLKAYHLFLKNNNKLGASRTAGWTGLDYLEIKGEFAVANGWLRRAEHLLNGIPDSWEQSFIKILRAKWVTSLTGTGN